MYEAILPLAFSLGFLACFVSLPLIMKKMRSAGIVGPDVHKKNKPAVPEMGGIGILVGLAVCMVGVSLLLREEAWTFLCFLAVVLGAGLIGALDDLKPLNPIVKPALTALTGLPILLVDVFITDVYAPRPVLPFVGSTRLTIVYPLIIPLVTAVSANAVNMMDSFNGEMPATSSITVLVLLVSAVLLGGRGNAALMCTGLLGCLLAFYYFNRHPAKTFAGDVGSLSVGAAIGAIAIMGRLEVVALVAFMPQIMNAFYGLATIGRLYERREVPRPTLLLKDGRLAVSDNTKAPITLARMVLARGPLYEGEIVRVLMIMQIISAVLSLFTLYLVAVAP